jgi:hypothetical protein
MFSTGDQFSQLLTTVPDGENNSYSDWSSWAIGSEVKCVVNDNGLDINSPGSLTGDGITIEEGDTFLYESLSYSAAQRPNHGPWIYNGSSLPLVRPDFYRSGASIPNGILIIVRQGTLYENTLWIGRNLDDADLDENNEYIVDLHDTEWDQWFTSPANLTDHISDSSEAHFASAIAISDNANDFTSTNVEDALAELQSADEIDEAALVTHITDTSDAHDASAISYVGGTGMSATDVEAAIDELATEKADLASPALTGNPTAPTPSSSDDDTSIATTAFVNDVIDARSSLISIVSKSSAAQIVGSSTTYAAVTFDEAGADPLDDDQGWFTDASDYFNIPADGWYEATANLAWVALTTSGSVSALIQHQNSSGAAIRNLCVDTRANMASPSAALYHPLKSRPFRASANERIQVLAWQSNTGATNRNINNEVNTWFALRRIA